MLKLNDMQSFTFSPLGPEGPGGPMGPVRPWDRKWKNSVKARRIYDQVSQFAIPSVQKTVVSLDTSADQTCIRYLLPIQSRSARTYEFIKVYFFPRCPIDRRTLFHSASSPSLKTKWKTNNKLTRAPSLPEAPSGPFSPMSPCDD